jgi:hypothetical protein
MPHSDRKSEKPSTTLPGTVQKIIKPAHPKMPEQVEITVENAEELYREIRVENALVNEKGEEVGLKPGAPVEVTIEADAKDTVKKDTVNLWVLPKNEGT